MPPLFRIEALFALVIRRSLGVPCSGRSGENTCVIGDALTIGWLGPGTGVSDGMDCVPCPDAG
jgi:hypothetical protein